jgi:ABC-2 type transport system permease protein
MTAAERLQRRNDHGWRMGLANLLEEENGKWWRTRHWLTRGLIWTFFLCVVLAGALFTGQGAGATGAVKLDRGLTLIALLGGIFPPILLTIIAQDALIGEKQSGTAAWVLSKPVSRVAVIVSKLTANALGALVMLVLFPGVVSYALLAAASGQFLAPHLYLAGLGALFVNLLFYLSLTILLGTVYDSRGPVIGIPLAVVLGFQFVLGIAPWMMTVMPWGLISPAEQGPSLVVALIEGQAPPSWLPLVCTVVWITLFVALAIRQYGRQEF